MTGFRSAMKSPSDWVSKWVAASLLVCVPLISRLAYGDEVQDQTLTRRIPSYSAAYVSSSINVLTAPGRSGSAALIIERPGNPPAALELPREVIEVNTITRSDGDMFIVISDIGGGGRDVAVVDSKHATLIDHFWCYQPSLSPNHRYIAFKRFFPEHGVDDQQSSNFEMLYDVAVDAAQNRASPPAKGDRINHGRLLYPPEYKTVKTIRGAIPITHTFPSPAVWSVDSKKFVLLDSVYPGDAFSSGAYSDGNILLSHKISPSPVALVVLFTLTDATSRSIRVGQFRTNLCRPQGTSFCYLNLAGANYTDREVTVDTGRKTTIAFSKFRRIGTPG